MSQVRTGFTLTKGESGQRVSEGTIVYTSAQCLTKIGEKTNETDTENGTLTGQPVKLKKTNIEVARESMEKSLNAQLEKVSKMDLKSTSTASITAWFDSMEAYIDALPRMNSDGTIIYEVEQKEGETFWTYNGNYYEADAEFNAKMNDIKRKICRELNNKLSAVAQKLTSILNAIISKFSAVEPFIKIMNILVRVPSLETIIKWAKSVIDFAKNLFTFLFSVYQTALALLEIVIIRFPQLMNKIMNKITEFDCNITAKTTSVKVNKSAKK